MAEIDMAEKVNSPERQLTPKEAAEFLRVSESWLAKERMRGDGPPFAKFGRAVRYGEGDLLQYVKSRRRLSTSDR
jgi:predicted DNA-binding transcriptional regulator AlpA